MGCADQEFRGIDLGDTRRDKRAARLLERLAERPTASIPGAYNGWAETQAAYRFLGGDAYEWSDILEPHRQCTRVRMGEHPVVLCIQDTTEILEFDSSPGPFAAFAEAPLPRPLCRLCRFAGPFATRPLCRLFPLGPFSPFSPAFSAEAPFPPHAHLHDVLGLFKLPHTAGWKSAHALA